ncbi:MAG: hypothetical protein ASARMPREDX12_005378 [Alectoria sarmentosa]|nr:MAG: hypothetical protein ASARMPREDX12_005378 [Alectoria sarmentosa]
MQSILEPSLLQDLIQYGDQTVQDTISLLKFQEHFYYTVFLRPGMNESLLVQDEHIVPKFSGFSAIIIALMLDIVPEALHSHMISVISDWRQLMLGEKTSTIEHFAFMILYLYNLEIENLNLDYIEAGMDMELKMSLGLEMARYQRVPEAAAILGSCVKDMETAGCIGSRECCVITTELIKCCNLMSEEAKAESLARQVLESQRDPQLQFQHDLCHLNLALADTLIGQGEYKSAESLMLNVLAVGSLPKRTQTIVRLRLNKARRRLGRNDLIASAKGDFTQPILESIADLDRDLKIEVLAELSATISLAPKPNGEVFEKVTDLICNTVAAMTADSDMEADWRILALKQDLNRLKFRSVEKGTEKEVLVLPRRLSFQPGLEHVEGPIPILRYHQSYHPTLLGRLFSWHRSPRGKVVEKEEDSASGRSSFGLLRRLFSPETNSFPNADKYPAPFSESSRFPNPDPSVELVPQQTINEQQRPPVRTSLSHADTGANVNKQLTPNHKGTEQTALAPSNILLRPERLPQRVLEDREELFNALFGDEIS